MIFEEIIKMLDDLKTEPYVNSKVTHSLRNSSHQEVSICYSKSSGLFQLHSKLTNQTNEYSQVEDIARKLFHFIKD